MPLRRRSGEFFGTLCALDTAPAALPAHHLQMFDLIADLIAHQLEAEERHAARGQALLDAEEAMLFRDRFVAILGHDLRNPLAAIDSGAALLLTRDDLAPAHGGIVRRIARSAARINEIISAVLDTVRGRFGIALPVSPQRADAVAIVRQVVDEVTLSHQGREIALETVDSVSVHWDAARIAQMLSNVLGNALQYSPRDTTVRVTVASDAGGVTLAVQNQGATIPAETLRHIFEPFRRGGREAGDGTGLGLGLFIARSIASAHGGRLDVVSAHGTTTFTARLPAVTEPFPGA